MVIEFLDQLVESEIDESLARDLAVILWKEANPFDFVLEGLLPLLTTHDCLDTFATAAISEIDEFLHLSFVFRRENTSLLHVHFTVITVGVTPLEILVGSLLQVHFNVLKGVLLVVTNSQIRMLLYATSGWDCLDSNELDQC